MMIGTERDQLLLHAMDLAAMREWDDAKAIVESLDDPASGRLFLLICELEGQERARNLNISMVRHEIGNALTIAQANIEGIVDGVLEPTPDRLEGILASFTSATRLLEDLKKPPDRAMSAVIKIETFNICALVGAHASAIEGLARAKDVSIIYDPCGMKYASCENYRGDPARVSQILRNVLINAVRYTPPGGSVEIRCDRPDGDLSLVVRDTGIGISTHDLPHIFEPGYRGENAPDGGTGIGLSVVQKLLRSLGGEARAIAHDGSGAEFVVRLPVTPLGV
jgi:signal transduction histidine kinase